MRPRCLTIFLLCLVAPFATAADNARQAQVTAATGNAVEAIEQEIGNQSIGTGITVKDFLRETHSDAALRNLLEQSQPVGGPRWLDEQTCQVRIEVDGDKVADLLASIARDHPAAGITADSPGMDDLRRRRFEVTTTSAAANTANVPAPADEGASLGITPDQHRRLLLAARHNAAEHVLTILGPIEAANGRTTSQAMSDTPLLRERLMIYLQTAPITSVDIQNNSQAEIKLRPSREELAEIIYTTSTGKTSDKLDADDFYHLEGVHDRIVPLITEVSGSASVSATGDSSIPPVLRIPAEPPGWVDGQLDAVGHGLVQGSQLKSVHAAGHDALLNLRGRLEALHLDDSHTILDAATRDPHVADAINQVLEQARPYKSEFNGDGSVTTHEILDLHDFWQALTASP